MHQRIGWRVSAEAKALARQREALARVPKAAKKLDRIEQVPCPASQIASRIVSKYGMADGWVGNERSARRADEMVQ